MYTENDEQENTVRLKEEINEENETNGKNHLEEKEVYKSDKYISGPRRVEDGTVPMNILNFHHSFSYDCQKYFNLCVAEPNIVIFASGNILHFLNTSTKEVWFRRGYTGGGIGHITKNPIFDHIAVGENGTKLPIIIYNWPSMEIVTVLYGGGTSKCYSYLAYSANGLLLISQEGHPNYAITLWNWQKSKIILKCKSYNRDVYNVVMSPLLPGHLVTSGCGHIKFWKISETFTGLKLKGEIGRFGQTEISDIIGVYIMPDGKVVSGCEWGNILLWEAGLITFEICRKGREPCHTKAITQFEYINGELISVGMDGWIRIWFYETIDQADSYNGERFLEIHPIYEYQISEGDEMNSSMLMCIRKQIPNKPEDTFWYVQDGNGAIWLIDLNVTNPELPQKIFTCHAGAIVDMDNATWGPFIATLGKSGHLLIYNYIEKKLILSHIFHDIGSQIIWFPCQIEATGSTLACAFESGVIRIIIVSVALANTANNIKGDYVRLIQVIKPHKMAITAMSLNPSYRLLVTGSEDSTVFSFYIKTKIDPLIVPIGFVKVPSGVTYLTWKSQHETTLLIGCLQGYCAQVTLPSTPQPYTTASYELIKCQVYAFRFQSVKSAIRRELIRLNLEEEKKAKMIKIHEELTELMIENSMIEMEKETFLTEMEMEDQLPDIYIPKIPNKVLIAQYINHDTIWLSMGGFDAGYMYEYPSPRDTKIIAKEPIRSTVIYDADDTEIHSCLFYKNRKYLFLGMEHGQIRVCKWKSKDYTDLSDYWILSMHDNYNGHIRKIMLSYDHKMLFTCGNDGNLFSYEINDDTSHRAIDFETIRKTFSLPHTNVEDIEDADHASLEEIIQQTEHYRIIDAARRSKTTIIDILFKLKEDYNKIVRRNNALPKSHRITRQELELDPRITADLNKELEAEMVIVKEKLAYKVQKSELRLQKLLEHFIQPITCLPFGVCKILKPDKIVCSLRQYNLQTDVILPHIEHVKHIYGFDKRMDGEGSIQHVNIKEEKEKRQEEEKEKERATSIKKEKSQIADFLKGINCEDLDSSLGIQLNQVLRKYNLMKSRLEEREEEWKIINDEKPDISISHKYDMDTIEDARKTIGDYKLKMSSTFDVLSVKQDTLFSKYKELLTCWKGLYHLQEAFNTKLKAIRTEKENFYEEILCLIKSLKSIHAEIPSNYVKPLPTIPTLNVDIEFPEKKIMIEKYTLKANLVKDIQRERKSIASEQDFFCFDEEYEVLLLKKRFSEYSDYDNQLEFFTAPQRKIKVQCAACDVDDAETLYLKDDVDSPWEREMKSSRILSKIYEQDRILRYIQSNCENLDKKLDKLEHDRLDIVAENVHINLFLLTLRQEYIILKEYETMETVLHDKVKCNSEEVAALRQKIQTITNKIDSKTKEITRLRNQIRDITSEYMGSISDNKFYTFLRQIFKKKYKLLKEEDETTTTTTTDETSPDEIDDKEIDDREIDTIYFNENVCPPECDLILYNLAFSMRKNRYTCEHQIQDAERTIEIFHKETEIEMRKFKLVEDSLKKNEENLKTFMIKKQSKLNDVDVTVTMKLHQLQYFEESEILPKVNDCVIFDKNELSKLYARIQELHEETLELHAKHKQARMHLQRIKLDCNHMRNNNNNLKDEIKQNIMNKFNQDISLIKLYETMIRRMAYDIKVNLNEATISFNKQIKNTMANYTKELITYKNVMQEYTQKFSFLTLLTEEKSKFQKLLKQHVMSDEEMLELEEKYQKDIIKLERILRNQLRQKFSFQKDIKNLRLKATLTSNAT